MMGEWDDILAKQSPVDDQARANVIGASLDEKTPNPDGAAKTYNAAKSLGLPSAVGELDPKGTETQDWLQNRLKIMQDSPSLNRYLAKDPAFAKISHDDYDQLSIFGKALESMKKGYQGGILAHEIAQSGAGMAFGGKPSEQLINLLRKQDDFEEAQPPGTLHKIASGLGNLYSTIFSPEAAVGAGIGLLGGPAAPATVPAGMMVGAALRAYQDSSVAKAIELDNWKGANGETIPKWGQVLASQAVGLFNAGAMAVGMDTAGPKLMSDILTEGIKNPTVQQAIAKGLYGTAKAGVTGGTLNVGMDYFSLFAGDLAKQLNDPTFKATLNDPEKREEFFQNGVDSFITGAALFGGLHGLSHAGPGAFALLDAYKGERARANMEKLQQANDAADATMTMKRAPEALKEFVDGVLKDQSIDVPVHALDAATGNKTEEVLPGVKDQLDAARSSQGQISIPAKDYFALERGVRDKLLPDTRLHSDDLTVNEATELQQQTQALAQSGRHEYNTEDARKLVETADKRRISNDLSEKLKEAGVKEEEANLNGQIWAQVWGTLQKQYMPERSAFDVYKEEGLSVLRGSLSKDQYEQAAWGDIAGNTHDDLKESSERWLSNIESGNKAEGSFKMIEQASRQLSRLRPNDEVVKKVAGATEALKEAVESGDKEKIALATQVERAALSGLYQHVDEIRGGRLTLMQETPTAPNFYSALNERLAEAGKKQPKAVADQWLGPKGKEGAYGGILGQGVKPEEIEWRGLPEFFAEKKRLAGNKQPVVTADEIREHLKSRETRLIEDREAPDPYSQYQLKGGSEPFRLSMVKHDPKYEALLKEYEEARDEADRIANSVQNRTWWHPENQEARDRWQAAHDKALKLSGELEEVPGFRSSHTKEKDNLGWFRAKTRIGPNGEKILHAAELQTDLHKEGRQFGYRAPGDDARLEKIGERRDEIEAELKSLKKEYDQSKGYDEDQKKYDDQTAPLYAELDNLADEQNELAAKVPDSPFKGYGWAELLIKKMIRYAAERGYDKIALDTGQTQVERYPGLIQHGIRRLEYDPENEYFYAYKEYGEGGRPDINTHVPRKDLANWIGQETAEQLLRTEPKEGLHSLALNEGMDVGKGKGQYKFYDKDLLNLVNKIIKRFGGRVYDSEVPVEGKGDYVGPNRYATIVGLKSRTASDSYLQQVLDRNGASNYSPVILRAALRDTAKAMAEHDLSFGEALPRSINEISIRKSVAEVMGGKIETSVNAPVHMFDMTPELKNVALMRGFPMFQEPFEGSGARGQITLGEGRSIIKLFEKADPSTFLHEMGHLWLDTMLRRSQTVDAPELLKSDVKNITDWLGVEHPDEVGVEHHERFASAFERYLSEGVAPTPELRSVFAKVKDWMLGVYHSASNAGQEINPEVKKIFDKMFATDEELRAKGLPQETIESVKDLGENGPRRLDRVLTILRSGDPDRAELMLNVVGDDLKMMHQAEGIGGEARAGIEQVRKALREGDIRAAEKRIEDVKIDLGDLVDQYGRSAPREPEVHGDLAGQLPVGGPMAGRAAGTPDLVSDNADAGRAGIAVAAARKELHLQNLFSDAAAAGMTKPEFNTYAKKVQEVVDSQVNKARERAVRQIKRREGEDWAAKEKEIRSETLDDLADKPVNRADEYFQSGTIKGKPVPSAARAKLDESLVRSKYGDKALDGLPSYAVDKKGVDPDEIAEYLGFKSGKSLINSLRTLEKKRANSGLTDEEFWNKTVDNEVSRRMEARYGNDDALADARGDVLSKGQSDLLADELAYLARLGGTKPAFTSTDVRGWASEQFLKQPVAGARDTSKYIRETGKAGRSAELALLKGDFVGALEAKQRQLINYHQLKLSKDFNDEAERVDRTLKRYSKDAALKDRAQDFTDQIHAMMQEVGMGIPRTPQSMPKQTIEDFISDKVKEWGIPVPPLRVRNVTMEKMNAEQFSDWSATLMSMDKVSRDMKKLYKMHEAAEFDDVKNTILENLKSIKKKDFDERSPFQSKLAKGIRSMDSSMIMPERMMDWADKGNSLGPFNTYVFRALVSGVNDTSGLHWTMEMKKAMARDFKDIKMKFNPKDKVDNDTLLNPFNELKPMDISEGMMTAMILHWGTDSNEAKLLGGFKWEKEDVEKFLEKNARKEHWDFAQGVWNALERLRPHVAATTKRVTGVPVDLIEDRKISTPHGEYTGKYFPLTEDWVSRVNRAKTAVEEPLENRRWLSLPTAQARKARTGAIYPVDLSLETLPGVIEETIHYLGMVEPVIQARKILSDKEIRTGFSNALGTSYTEKLYPWLDSIARNGDLQDYRAAQWWTSTSQSARAHMTSFLVGLNPITAQLHGGGAGFNSLIETPVAGWKQFVKTAVNVPPSTFMSYWGKLFRNEESMENMTNFVYSKSGELRNRSHAISDEISQVWFKKMLGGPLSRMDASFMAFNMSALRALDQWSSVATWNAVYDQALKRGVSDSDSVYMADKAVRNAHGSSSVVSRAGVQWGGGEVGRWFTMFMGFFVNNYNLNRSTARVAAGKMDIDSAFGTESSLARMSTVAARTVVAVGLMGFLHHYFRGQPKKDQGYGDYAMDTILGQVGGGMPIIRDVAREFESFKDPSTPIDTLVKNITQLPIDIRQGLEGHKVSDKWVKHAMDFAGSFPGVPTAGKITASEARAAQFLWDVHKGKERPLDWSEWWRGLETGHAKERKF